MTAELLTEKSEQHLSPEFVRISMAAAIELGLKPGKISRCGCGCINLLQNYPAGCAANCSYCGLARERAGLAQDNTFIRVSWPLFRTDIVAEKIGERDVETNGGVGRVCIAQVHDGRAYRDLIDMTERVRHAAPDVPISALVSSGLLNEDRLAAIQKAGADIIGIGLDAASEEVFEETRGSGVRGPHDWDQHWEIARAARRRFGPYKVNFHVVVGIGETDRDLVDLFHKLHSEQIAAYLFSFNPEPGTAMQDVPRAPIHRLRRIQLVKHLIEHKGLERGKITFDDEGALMDVDALQSTVAEATNSGVPFMTDGCPNRQGEVACNRPFGSYRPGEEYRDYPFQPNGEDLETIRSEMRPSEVFGESPEKR